MVGFVQCMLLCAWHAGRLTSRRRTGDCGEMARQQVLTGEAGRPAVRMKRIIFGAGIQPAGTAGQAVQHFAPLCHSSKPLQRSAQRRSRLLQSQALHSAPALQQTARGYLRRLSSQPLQAEPAPDPGRPR